MFQFNEFSYLTIPVRLKKINLLPQFYKIIFFINLKISRNFKNYLFLYKYINLKKNIFNCGGGFSILIFFAKFSEA